ncbi:MAG: hypothetical protein J6W89_06165 [Paludibacteraceae bacterium]|nr:hypothetical protein [Paludibacteraceae bacterium]
MKHNLSSILLAAVASVMMVGTVSAAPKLTYNGVELAWNTEFERTLVDYLNPDAVIPEVSGIACSRVTPGYIWMQSDEIQDYLIATDETGQTRYAKVQFPGENYLWDWEDLCGGVYNGKNYLFIGAFGDNNEERNDYCIVWFEEPEITGGQINITPSRINFQYPEGKKHNAEAIMYDNVEQMLYVITKVYYDVCQVFKLPFRTDYGNTKQTLEYVCDLGVKADLGEGSKPDKGFHLVTAADITPDGKYILIKNQNNTNPDYSWILLWERQEGESVADAVKRQPQPLKCYEVEWQGEAICWKDNDTFFTTSDSDQGERPPLYKYTRKGQTEPVSKRSFEIDGEFEDWADLNGLAHAEDNAADNALSGLRIYADEEALYFYLEFKPEAAYLTFFLNTDENSATGYNAWMWNTTAEYMLSGSVVDNLSDMGLYAFGGANQEDWTWNGVEVEDLITASAIVALENGHKAVEARIAMDKLPAVPLHLGVYSSNSSWSENGFMPKSGNSMLEVEIYQEQTAVETVMQPAAGRKVLRDGQILILRGGKTYTLTGQEMK